MEVILKSTRTAFANIYKPQAIGDSEPAWSLKNIIEPGSENEKILDAAMAAVAKEKWKEKADSILKMLTEKNKVCFSKKPYLNKDGVPYDGFEGMYNLSSRNAKVQPTVKNKRNETVKEGDPGAPYNGCYVHVSLDIWAQDNNYGQRINATLQGVMFASDGPAFGGGRPATDETFKDLAVPEDAESDFA